MYILVYILQSLREKILALIQDQHSESVDNKIAQDRDKYHKEIVIRAMDKVESITSQVED